jgi:hypothetical protein
MIVIFNVNTIYVTILNIIYLHIQLELFPYYIRLGSIYMQTFF